MSKLDALDVKPGANAGTEFELVDAAGEGTGIFVTILGKDSDEWQTRANRAQHQRVQKLFRNGVFRSNAILTPEQDKANEVELLAVCTKSWRTVNPDKTETPTVSWRGTDYECNFENAKLLYSNIVLMFEQAKEAAEARANFTKSA